MIKKIFELTMLTLVCKVVSRDGNVQNFHIQLNILTGEYTLI